MTDLPVDIDSSYPDRSAGDAAHQQHHDFLHALWNELKGSESAAGVATLRALLDGTYAALNAAQFGVVSWGSGLYYYPAGGTKTTLLATANQLEATPFAVSKQGTIDRLGCFVSGAGSAGSVTRLGIYGTAASGLPGDRLLDAGVVDSTSTGSKEITVSQVLPSGLYWLTAVAQGAPATEPTFRVLETGALGRYGLNNNSDTAVQLSGYAVTGVTGALPASFGTPGRRHQTPLLFVRSA